MQGCRDNNNDITITTTTIIIAATIFVVPMYAETVLSTQKVITEFILGTTQPGDRGSEKRPSWWRAQPGIGPQPGLLGPVALQAPPTWAGRWALREAPDPRISHHHRTLPPDRPQKVQLTLPGARKVANLHFMYTLRIQTPLRIR